MLLDQSDRHAFKFKVDDGRAFSPPLLFTTVVCSTRLSDRFIDSMAAWFPKKFRSPTVRSSSLSLSVTFLIFIKVNK